MTVSSEFVLVPREATREMKEALICFPVEHGDTVYDNAERIYHAMISAAPTPRPSSNTIGGELAKAREAFLDLMADAKWKTDTDDGGTTHTIETGDSQLADLAKSLGIEIQWRELTEDAIVRAVDAGPQPIEEPKG